MNKISNDISHYRLLSFNTIVPYSIEIVWRRCFILKQKVRSKIHKILMDQNFCVNTVFINFDERGVKCYVIYDGCPLR